MVFYYYFIYIFFLVNIIHSYYIFPFKYHRPDLSELYLIHSNLSKEEIFLNYINSLSLYTIIKINDSKIYRMILNSKEKCSFITNDTCVLDNNNYPQHSHINSNISNIFEEIIHISKNVMPCQCNSGVIGLALPGYTSKSTCFPMINEIKKNDNTIKNQVWSIKYYNSSQNKDFDGEIIIGIEPHEYEPTIYNESDYHQIYNYINQDYYDVYDDEEITKNYRDFAFTIKFEKVYYYNDSKSENIIELTNSESKEAELEFDLGMIKCPFVYWLFIKNHFFQEYINLNICEEIKGYYTFVCDKKKLNNKLEQFYKSYPNIYFFSVNLNYTFSLGSKDLFLEKDDKIYYQIFSKNEEINNWRLGQIFLKKYFFTFDNEKKMIGFYIKNLKNEKYGKTEDKETKKESSKINYNILILIIVVVLLIIEIGFAIYCINRKCLGNNRRKRANELTDDNFDYLSINNNG